MDKSTITVDDEAAECLDTEATMLWIECGSCSGESMAILGAEGPGKEGYNLLDFLEHNQVQMLCHEPVKNIAFHRGRYNRLRRPIPHMPGREKTRRVIRRRLRGPYTSVESTFSRFFRCNPLCH